MADGIDCTCFARSPGECACDADWTPQKVYDQAAEIERLCGAIKKYGWHLKDCDLLNPAPLGRAIKCTCGFDSVTEGREQ